MRALPRQGSYFLTKKMMCIWVMNLATCYMTLRLHGKNWRSIITSLHMGTRNSYTLSIYPFPPEKFPHLAGKIRHSQIEKGSQYEESVKPRLEALIRLKETIEQEFLLHSYMPRFYSFVIQIKADYLIQVQKCPLILYSLSSPIHPEIFRFVTLSVALLLHRRNGITGKTSVRGPS